MDQLVHILEIFLNGLWVFFPQHKVMKDDD